MNALYSAARSILTMDENVCVQLKTFCTTSLCVEVHVGKKWFNAECGKYEKYELWSEYSIRLVENYLGI